MKFPKDTMKAIIFGDSPDGFECVEEGDWISEGKYECAEYIFLAPDEKHYAISCGRTGSYFTDWDYDCEYWDEEVEVNEVELKEVVKMEWVSV